MMKTVLFSIVLLGIIYSFDNVYVNGQVTKADAPFFRPMYRMLRKIALNAIGRTGESERSIQKNAKANKLQTFVTPNIPFFCDVKEQSKRSKVPPSSVHKLRPGDIDIIGALGDSLTAGNGGLATNILQVITENKGISWTIGGQKTWREFLTVPNIIKVFNPNLYGYSMGDALSFERKTKFNVAELGAMSRDTIHMAKVLIKRIKHDSHVDVEKHWKLITLLIGPNDFCYDICYVNPPEKIVENHEKHLLQVLRLFRDNLPRTMLNVVLAPSINILLHYKNTPALCVAAHHFECPCFFGFQFQNQHQRYLKIIEQWQEKEIEIVNMEEFQNRDDFVVNLQPFTKNIEMPKKDNGDTDFSYLSVDCFHFSQKGYALATNALWNNMLEPVGNKSTTWETGFTNFKCPTNRRPYLATKRNS